MSTTETMTTGAVQAAPRSFPACPNFEKEHKAAVIRYLQGGRTSKELEAMMAGRAGYPARFTPEDIRSIRRRYANGETQKSIAVDYGVYPTSIGRICHRETYKAVA